MLKRVIDPTQCVDSFCIDSYMELLNERNNKVRCLSIPFFQLLMPQGIKNTYELLNYRYDSVSNWFKEKDVYQYHKIFIPVCCKYHFAMIEVDIEKRKIIFYNSLKEHYSEPLRNSWLKGIKRFMIDSTPDNNNNTKKKTKTNSYVTWAINNDGNSPQQTNGVDCGIFTMLCADYRSDNLPLDYNQEEMVFFRKKIAADLYRGRLDY